MMTIASLLTPETADVSRGEAEFYDEWDIAAQKRKDEIASSIVDIFFRKIHGGVTIIIVC